MLEDSVRPQGDDLEAFHVHQPLVGELEAGDDLQGQKAHRHERIVEGGAQLPCRGQSAVQLLANLFDRTWAHEAGERERYLRQDLLAVGCHHAAAQGVELRVDRTGLDILGEPAVPVILTALWIVGMINSINWIDGLDGLATGIAMFASIALFLISIQGGIGIATYFYVSIAGATLAGVMYAFMNLSEGMASRLKGFEEWAAHNNPFFEGPNSNVLGLIPFLLITILLYLVGRELVLKPRPIVRRGE